jgi:hypothetical protein
MATPSIQTLITQAQQVLNLQSSNEIRATLAAVLANANVGTPLNPNLTTQQLWDEFDEIVRQSTDDIMSIVVDQMMRMVFSPPAPGGAGADKQVIFNDGGVLAGDAGLTYNKATDALTITGDLTVDTSTLKVDSTNDRVGIGTASPAQILHLAKSSTSTALTAPPPGGANLRIQNTSSTNNNFSSIEFYNAAGLFGASVNCQSTNQATPSNDLVFVTRLAGLASEQMRVDSTGNVNISTGNVVMATSGKGIDFSATASGSGTMTSELLNDYEEGTFTPTIVGTTTAGVGVYSSQNAKYTKVGNLVTCYLYLAWTAHTGTGDMRIGGLPFATASAGGVYYAASIGFATNIALTAGYVMTAYALDNSSTLITLQQYPTGGGASLSVPIDVSAGIIVSISYAT